MYRSNKKDTDKKSTLIIMLAAGLFALLFTLILGFFYLLIMGSTVVIDSLFTLQINPTQLMKLAIFYLLYWLILDTFFEGLGEHLLGKNFLARMFIALFRMVIFYLIGNFIGLTMGDNLILSIGVAFILLAIDLLYLLRKKNDN